MKDDLLGPEPHRQAQEGPLEPAIQLQVVAWGLAFSADPFSRGPLDVKDNPAAPEFRSKVPIAFQAHGMVQVARRRQDRPPVVSSQIQR
jgi:hypothetical protein